MSVSKHLQDKLALLPDSPGCYIMKDENQNILYVGKAKVLKNRVRSYFHGTHNNKTTRLVSHIRDFEFIVTGSEKEALLLEINLIKKHTPPYNIMFMDDKRHIHILRLQKRIILWCVQHEISKIKRVNILGRIQVVSRLMKS